MNNPKSRSWRKLGCITILTLYFSGGAIAFYPDFLWELPAAFGVLAFVSLFLRVGWTVPFTLAGSYFGVAVGFPAVASGPWGSEGPRVLICTAIGIVAGLVIGASIDRSGE